MQTVGRNEVKMGGQSHKRKTEAFRPKWQSWNFRK